MAEEFHGLFQFVDDELFSSKDAADEFVLDSSYVPVSVSTGWFVSKDIEFTEKQGPNHLRNKIEYLYFKKQYKECLENSMLWLELSKQTRLKGAEIVEIAIRCHIKLNNFPAAMKLLEVPDFKDSNDTGIIFIRGNVYRLNECYPESLSWFIKYLDNRPNDFQAWLEISQVFLDASSKSNGEFRQLAWAAYEIANYLMKKSPTTKSEFVYRNKDFELISQRLGDCADMHHESINFECLNSFGVDVAEIIKFSSWIDDFNKI